MSEPKKFEYFGKYKNSEQVTYKNKILQMPYSEPQSIVLEEPYENQEIFAEIDEITAINDRVESEIDIYTKKTRDREDYE